MSDEIVNTEGVVPEHEMLLAIPCRRCGAEITGASEEDLVSRVHTHIRTEHGSEHAPEREHLLSHARRIAPTGSP